VAVSIEVWRQLDPAAGRLSRATVLRLRSAIVVVSTLMTVAALVWYSGVAVPRLRWSEEGGFGWATGPDFVSQAVHVRNSGWVPLNVIGAGRSGPGLQLIAVQDGPPEPLMVRENPLPQVLRPGQSLTFVVVYRITDCSAIPTQPWPVPVRVQRPWGVQTVYIPVPPQPAAPGSIYVNGPYVPMVEWQRTISDDLCIR
jgi:hypothetical protein